MQTHGVTRCELRRKVTGGRVVGGQYYGQKKRPYPGPETLDTPTPVLREGEGPGVWEPGEARHGEGVRGPWRPCKELFQGL